MTRVDGKKERFLEKDGPEIRSDSRTGRGMRTGTISLILGIQLQLIDVAVL